MPLASGLPSLEEIVGRNGQGERRCRVCGCTDTTACLHPEHGPCWWVEDDLCSHCGEPSIVAGDYDAVLGHAGGNDPLAAWARRACAALQHVSQAKADLFEL